MATCQTPRWVSTAPYVKLTVTESASTATTSTLSYTLQYISDTAANTSNAKSYMLEIDGKIIKEGSFNIDGLTGTHTICSGTIVVSKSKAKKTIECYFEFYFNLTWSGSYAGQKDASTTIDIGAKTQYSITYNANGGTGAPSAQSKWHGEALTLSSTKPTKTGHSFQGWATSSTATAATYQPGASYTTNAALTLYAVWKVNTYTVAYNANGGKNAPAAQTKTYGTNLTLTTLKPTRTNYTFKGWATAASSSVIAYQPGGTYTANAAATLYAVWEQSYALPKIYNVSAEEDDPSDRETDSNGIVKNLIRVYFNCSTTYANPSCTVSFHDETGEVAAATRTFTLNSDYSSNKAGTTSNTFIDIDKSYTIKITVTDSGGSSTATTTFTGNVYPIDFLAGGKGVSFGGAAALEDTAHFQWDARFDKSVCGNVPGMYKLPEIKANDDFNNYMTTGCWAVYNNANAETIKNIPVARAGRLEVWSSTGEGIRAAQWSYLRQRFIPYNNANATWERDIARGADNSWNYYEWHRTTLTPDASKKIYSKSVLSASLTADIAMTTVSTYTRIPMKSYKFSSGNLTLDSVGRIKIGAGINMVKVSGQVLVKCGTKAGNRHIKIQKVTTSNTVTDIAWCCITGVAQDNLVFPFTPTILNVSEGEALQFAYYTADSGDTAQSGSGCQTYITVEEF